jgi:hypothetical protein
MLRFPKFLRDPIGWETRPCIGTDPLLWFGPAEDEPYEPFAERIRREGIAKTICAECPFTTHCLDLELRFSIADQHGVRGGLTAEERRDLLRTYREERRAA